MYVSMTIYLFVYIVCRKGRNFTFLGMIFSVKIGREKDTLLLYDKLELELLELKAVQSSLGEKLALVCPAQGMPLPSFR